MSAPSPDRSTAGPPAAERRTVGRFGAWLLSGLVLTVLFLAFLVVTRGCGGMGGDAYDLPAESVTDDLDGL